MNKYIYRKWVNKWIHEYLESEWLNKWLSIGSGWTNKWLSREWINELMTIYSETLNKEYIGRIYQMSSWQFFNEFYTILRKFQYLRK